MASWKLVKVRAREVYDSPHARFKISRELSFAEREAAALRPLPEGEYEVAEFKTVSPAKPWINGRLGQVFG